MSKTCVFLVINLALIVWATEYSKISRSILCLLFSWLICRPSHQQAWKCALQMSNVFLFDMFGVDDLDIELAITIYCSQLTWYFQQLCAYFWSGISQMNASCLWDQLRQCTLLNDKYFIICTEFDWLIDWLIYWSHLLKTFTFVRN